jgi:N-acetylglucosamine-6-phosphate deacetylase
MGELLKSWNPGCGKITGVHYETGRHIQIEFEEGVISSIKETGIAGDQEGKLFIAPGMIDNQVNGYHGINFADENFTTERLKFAAKAIFADGVTSFLPTLVTNGHEELKRNFRILSDSLKDEVLKKCIPGFHLEGPYLSKEPGFYGCHPVEFLRDPSVEEFIEYQEIAGGRIIEVTISPELKGAMDLIKYCTGNGVAVALGHTNADTSQVNEAVRLGARLSTHLGNGCANVINRHRNPLWPQLANDLLTPSVIADGHHLLPEELIVFYKVKGPDNLILTSDVNHLIGMPPGDYTYMGSHVIMTGEGLVKNPVLNCLAGASLPLKRGVENMMRFTGCSLSQAMNLAGRNVARIYGLSDRGTLTEGKRADIILFKLEDNQVRIMRTLLSGEVVWSANE